MGRGKGREGGREGGRDTIDSIFSFTSHLQTNLLLFSSPQALYRDNLSGDRRLILDLSGLQLPVDNQNDVAAATAVTGGACADDPAHGGVVCIGNYKAPIKIEARVWSGACSAAAPAEVIAFDEAGFLPLDGTGGCARWSYSGGARPPTHTVVVGDCIQFVQKSTNAVLYQGLFVDEANLPTCRTLKQCPSFALACAVGECGCDTVSDPALAKPLCVLKN